MPLRKRTEIISGIAHQFPRSFPTAVRCRHPNLFELYDYGHNYHKIVGMATSSVEPSSQVRVQLSTRHPDISLPENPGPILVNTSNVILETSINIHTYNRARPATICPFNASQHSITARKDHTIRISHQWHIPSNFSRRVPHRKWHICRNHSCSRVCTCDHTATLSGLI